MLTKPSFYAAALNGFLILFLVIYIYNNYNAITRFDTYQMVMLIAVLTIVSGIHALIHLGLESVYNYNPIESKKVY